MTPEKAEAWRKYRGRGFWRAVWPLAVISGTGTLFAVGRIAWQRVEAGVSAWVAIAEVVASIAFGLSVATAVLRCYWLSQERRYSRAVAAAPPADP